MRIQQMQALITHVLHSMYYCWSVLGKITRGALPLDVLQDSPTKHLNTSVWCNRLRCLPQRPTTVYIAKARSCALLRTFCLAALAPALLLCCWRLLHVMPPHLRIRALLLCTIRHHTLGAPPRAEFRLFWRGGWMLMLGDRGLRHGALTAIVRLCLGGAREWMHLKPIIMH